MSPTPSRLRRALLRTIVLVQLVVLAMVAYTTVELLRYGTEVMPGTIAMVAAMLACTVIALWASFRRNPEVRGLRLFFMTAQAIAVLAPLVGYKSLKTIVVAGSQLPPDAHFAPEFVILTMAMGLLVAAMLAGISVLLAPLLLTPLREAGDE